MRGHLTRLVDNNRRWRSSPKRTRRTAGGYLSGGRQGQTNFSRSGVVSECRARTRLKQKRSREGDVRYRGIRISGRMYVLGNRSRRKLNTCLLCSFQQLEALRNNGVAGIEFACACVGVNGIGNLIVARLV